VKDSTTSLKRNGRPARQRTTASTTNHNLQKQLDQAQADLLQYQRGMEAVINSMGEGLIAIDENGTITTINDYALQCLGYQRHELLGAWFPGAVVAVDQFSQPIPPIKRVILRCLTTGQAITDRVYYQRQDGGIMPAHITVSPVLIDGKPVGAIEVLRDLTEEHQLDIAKDEFVSLASHQLRTPATGVMTILSMLASGNFGPLTPLQLKYVQAAARTNDRQLEIIEDLLNVARVDAGKMELEPEYTNLVTLVQEVAADSMPAVEKRNQLVRLTLPTQLMAYLDISRLKMVVDNLISNASKYSPPGTTIEVSLHTSEAHVVLSVRDQGVGISTEDIAKLGTKFTRLDNDLSLNAGGSGLGLFLVKSIIELHHGELMVDSVPGKGSTFAVALPYKPREES
jgi:PAS domain S-box-containing protein